MAKVTIIGSGNVGATSALYIAEKRIADVLLIDVVEGLARGKALDAIEAAPLRHYDTYIEGTEDFSAMVDSDVVVVTAGMPRKPGMSRYTALKVTGFALKRVVGMAGVLDSTRFRYFLADKFGVNVNVTTALVLGGHGDSMVPLPRYTTISGVPIPELLSKDVIDELVERTRKGGAEIVSYLKTGSAFWAPAASVSEMVECVVRDKKRILPCSAYLRGEYGIEGLFIGVPVKLGKNGVEEIVELSLTKEEREALATSAAGVRQVIEKLEELRII